MFTGIISTFTLLPLLIGECQTLQKHEASENVIGAGVIPIVETWNDLERVRPVIDEDLNDWRSRNGFTQVAIDGGDGRLTVRVGLETATVRCYEGVLAYCLTEGWDPGWSAGDRRKSLGPLSVVVSRKGPEGLADSSPRQAVAEEGRGAVAPFLFVRSICLTRPGEYVVRITDPKGNAVATRTIHCSECKDPPWLPWEAATNAPRATGTSDGEVVTVHVANPSGPVAVPDWDGLDAIPAPEFHSSERTALPRLAPTKPSPGIRLEVKREPETVLTLTSREPLLVSLPKDSFLTRWWVNGKPFVPEQEALQLYELARSRETKSTRQVEFRVEFDARRLGAKPGDTVSVQLLHCPGGWRYVGQRGEKESRAKKQHTEENRRIAFPRSSPRVEWMVKRDPE